jgi:hypothetical protein
MEQMELFDDACIKKNRIKCFFDFFGTTDGLFRGYPNRCKIGFAEAVKNLQNATKCKMDISLVTDCNWQDLRDIDWQNFKKFEADFDLGGLFTSAICKHGVVFYGGEKGENLGLKDPDTDDKSAMVKQFYEQCEKDAQNISQIIIAGDTEQDIRMIVQHAFGQYYPNIPAKYVCADAWSRPYMEHKIDNVLSSLGADKNCLGDIAANCTVPGRDKDNNTPRMNIMAITDLLNNLTNEKECSVSKSLQ